MIPSPNACRHCDEDERGHAQLWHPVVGFHRWEAPTDEVRLMRMKARRFFRLKRMGHEN
jgi:hypothetical protein